MRLSRAKVKSFLPLRPKNAHKGTFGRVLIVAGSANMSGAAVLCARAALMSGAGMVALALPSSRQCVAAAALPEMITFALPEKNGVLSLTAAAKLKAVAEEYKPNVLLMGPGLGKTACVTAFLKKNKIPCVLDADALNQLAADKKWHTWLKGRFPLILTPHPGEMKRLLLKPISSDSQIRREYAQELAQLSGGVALLKGSNSVISNGEKFYINPTGGPALSKAGTGDVLAGLMAGLWAQIGIAEGFDGKSAFKAAACGAYLHGLCADIAAEKLTDRCVLASDVIAALATAFKQILQEKKK